MDRFVRKVDRPALRADLIKLACFVILYLLAILLTACGVELPTVGR